ncbi:hypothetical protein SKAU_G00094340 [Synaphobranchus kaupii]|uniref:Uncharacterized protein n=1 Tax=Synaphobranchus kaupii TaxID=118154 RepID=A0A9Q1J6S0_SYNKA|nr:hypothetical protein SKAU_G00094340 [Synaphobranchus kaupii]
MLYVVDDILLNDEEDLAEEVQQNSEERTDKTDAAENNAVENEEAKEEEYRKNDPIRKFQIEYDHTSNTPSYHKKGKHEMMARLDNLGPFQFFFTVSCADMRWDENVTAILREKGLKIEYVLKRKTNDIDAEEGEEETIVHFNGGEAFTADAPNRKKHQKLLENVKDLLLQEETVSSILKKFPTHNENDKDEYEANREKRIKALLRLAGLNETNYDTYLEALKSSKGGYSLVMARDIDEVFVNSYNPEWTEAWNGNTDLQITLDYFAVITYVTEYYIKDDTGTMKTLLDAMKETESSTLKEKMATLMNVFISHRQMGEAEAVYKIFPDFHFRDSNVTTVFVPTDRREERSKFLIRVDDDPQYAGITKLNIPGREGDYMEKYDIISKYERRSKDLEQICLAQFAKMYTSAWKGPGDKEQAPKGNVPADEEDPKEKFNFVITSEEGISNSLHQFSNLKT